MLWPIVAKIALSDQKGRMMVGRPTASTTATVAAYGSAARETRAAGRRRPMKPRRGVADDAIATAAEGTVRGLIAASDRMGAGGPSVSVRARQGWACPAPTVPDGWSARQAGRRGRRGGAALLDEQPDGRGDRLLGGEAGAVADDRVTGPQHGG